MAERPSPTAPDAADGPDRPARSRRKLTMAEVFGDVLPDGSRDERAPEPDEDREEEGRERDLLRDVPPHHQ